MYRVLVCVILQKIARCFIRYISKPLQKRQKRKTSKTSQKRKEYLVRTGSPAIHHNFTHAIKSYQSDYSMGKDITKAPQNRKKMNEPPLLNFN